MLRFAYVSLAFLHIGGKVLPMPHIGFLMLIYGNSGLDIWDPRGDPSMLTPKRGRIWNAWDPASSKTPSPGLGVGGSPSRWDLRGQNPGQDPDSLCHFFRKCEKVHLESKAAPISPAQALRAGAQRGAPLLQFWHHEVTDLSAKAKP